MTNLLNTKFLIPVFFAVIIVSLLSIQDVDAVIVTDQDASLVIGFPDPVTDNNNRFLSEPTDIEFDSSGNLWVSDTGNNRIVRHSTTLTSFRTSDIFIGQTNSSSTTANLGGISANTLRESEDIEFDSSGNLWVADTSNNRVLRFSTPFSTGMAADLVIGQAGSSFTAAVANACNGAALLNGPGAIEFDSSGNLWVADTNEARILRFPTPFTSSMNADLVLGGTGGFSNCLSTTAQNRLNNPEDLAFDSSGNLWVVDANNNRVLRFPTPFSDNMNADLVIGQASSSFTANSADAGSEDGTNDGGFSAPFFLAFDGSGNLWVSEQDNNRVLKFTTPFASSMTSSFVVGQSDLTSNNFDVGAQALETPYGIAFDSSDDLWVADSTNSRVIRFPTLTSSNPTADLVIGQDALDDNGQNQYGKTASSLNQASGVAVDSSGNLWVADRAENRILRFPATVTNGKSADLVLGQTDFTSAGNTIAAGKRADSSNNLFFDSSGNLWSVSNCGVQRFSPPFSTGMAYDISIGNPSLTSTTCGSVTDVATQSNLLGATFDSSGNLWVADSNNHRVLRFSAPFTTGEAADLVLGQASESFTARLTGNTAKKMNLPTDVAFDNSGNLWVSEFSNNRIIRFPTPFTSSMSADIVIGQSAFGTGSASVSSTRLNTPFAIDFDSSGNLWAADYNNNRVLRYSSPFATGMAADLVLGQDGSFDTKVELRGSNFGSFNLPRQLTFDSAGNLWVAIEGQSRVLKFTNFAVAPVISENQITTGSNSITSGNFQLTFTASAFSNSGSITVQTTTTNPASSDPTGTSVGSFYEVTTAQNGGLSSRELTLTYSDSDVSGIDDLTTLVMQRFSDGSWSELTSTVDTTAKTVTATTTGFSTFTITGTSSSSSSTAGGGRVIFSPPKITDYMTSPTLVKFEDGSIGYGTFIQKEIAFVNEMPTATIETGNPIALSYKIKSPRGSDAMSYFAFYTNIRGDQSDIESSDTHIRYYKGKTLQVSDPKEFFSSANFTATKVDALNVVATFNVTFAKPMETSDVIVRIWDENRQGYTAKFIDALRVIEPIPFLNSGNPFTVETTNEGIIAVRSLADENKMWYLVNQNWKETPEDDQLDETISKKPIVKYVSLEEDGKEAYREFRLDLNQRWINEKYSEKDVTKTPNVIDRDYEHWDAYKKGQELIAQETMKKILDPTYKPDKSIQQLVYNNQDTTQNSLKSVEYEKPNKGLVGDDYVWYHYKDQRGLLETEKITQKNKVWLLGNNGTMEEISDDIITKLEKGFYGTIEQSTIDLLYDHPVNQIEPEVKKPISQILDRTHDYWDAYKKGQVMLAQTKLVDVTNYNFYETSPKIEQQKTFESQMNTISFTWNENILPATKGLDRTYEYWDTYKQGQILLAEATLNEIDPKVNESNTEDDLNETERWYKLKEEKQNSKPLNREHKDWDDYKYEQELIAQKKLNDILDPMSDTKNFEQANREALIAFQSRS